MIEKPDESLEDLDCEVLAAAGTRQVAIWKAIKGDYEELDEKQRARFNRIMEMWCVGQKLPKPMFNHNEGRSKIHNLLLQAFKAFKIRLYGFARNVRSKQTFIIVDIDPAKKQDKADPGILKRAKGRADDIGKGSAK